MAPAYFTVGNVQVTEKLFAYATVLIVSDVPFPSVGALLSEKMAAIHHVSK